MFFLKEALIMALEFPSEIPEIGDVVRINITIFKDSDPPKKSHDEIIDATVIYRRTWREKIASICLAHHAYREMEFDNGTWHCCWLSGQKHQAKLSVLRKAQ